jgi:DNA-binding response OmpR family regulator
MEKKTILIADDEPTILTAVRETLQDAYEVYTAKDGQEVFDVLKRVKPDVILLDIMMPVMGGIEACKKIKRDEETSSIPVMFLTAKGQLTDVEKGFKVGADSYIVKPFSASGLMQKVDAIISKLEMRKKMKNEKAR